MKKLFLVLVCGAAMWLLPTGNAEAIPLFYQKFEAKYAGAGAPEAFSMLVKEQKCNVCHVKGEKKEVRNAYGEALHKIGLEKAAAEKSAGGMTYGELLKSGKLPGEK